MQNKIDNVQKELVRPGPAMRPPAIEAELDDNAVMMPFSKVRLKQHRDWHFTNHFT